MNSDEMTAGSVSATSHERNFYAARSRWWNSTGGGSRTAGVAQTTKGLGGIRAGDGGKKFRSEWAEEDQQNLKWMEENRIDEKTGKCLPVPEEEVAKCSPEMVQIRKILGGGGKIERVSGGVQGTGQGFLKERVWWIVGGCFVIYVLISRLVGVDEL